MSTKYGIQPVPDQLKALDPQGFLDQLRKFALDTQAGRIAALASVSTSGTSPAPMPGPPGPPGPAAQPSEPDLTPPPTPVGTVTAGINTVYITTDAPTFTEGHGYNRTIVYGYKYGGSGPLPTFADAVVVHEFVGQVGSFSSDPGDQWHIWLKWRSNDGVLSTSPDGGANGHQVTTASDITNLLEVLSGQINTSQLASSLNARIDLIDGSGIGSVNQRIADGDAVLASQITNLSASVAGNSAAITTEATTRATVDGFLGAYYGIRTQISEAGRTVVGGIGIMGTSGGSAGPTIDVGVVANKFWIAAPAGSSGISDVTPFVVQTTDQVVNGVTIPKGVYMDAAYIKNLQSITARLGDAWITNAMVANLSASKLLAGSIAVGEYIQSSDFVTGVSGWRMGGNTAELGAASIRGQLTASQINGNGLVIRDNSGVPILGVGTGLPAAYLAAVIGGGNLLANSSFEADTDGDGVPDSWSLFTLGNTGSASLVRFAYGAAPHGSYVAAVTADALGGAGGDAVGVVQMRPVQVPAAGAKAVFSCTFAPTANPSGIALLVNVYNSSMVAIEQASTTFPSGSDFQRKSLSVNLPAGTAFVQCYVYAFGASTPGTTVQILVDAAQFELGEVLTAYAPGSVDKVGLDNRITGSNVSTYIASAAIGNAQIGGTISSDNYLPGVSGWAIAKSGTAEFDAAFIRGKLTTDQLEVGSATAISQVATLGQTGSFANTSLQTVGPFSIATGVPTTGAGLNFSGTFTIDISTIGMSASVASMVVSADIKVDSTVWVTSRTRVSRQPTGTPTIGTIVTLPMISRLVMAPGSYDFTLSISVWFLDSSGNAVAPGATPFYQFSMVGWFVENKV